MCTKYCTIYRNEIQKVPVTRCDSQLVLQKNGKVLVNIKIMLQKTHLKKKIVYSKKIEDNYLQWLSNDLAIILKKLVIKDII